MASILLTGGMGYIGSHTAVELLEAGYEVVLYDNLSNSDVGVKDKIQEITNKKVAFVEGDVLNTEFIVKTLKDYNIDSVIHFAGLKAVGESVEKPIEYFENNIVGSISLLKAMKKTGVKKIVFSSSATVYGEPEYLPYDEEHPTSVVNPYGRSKLLIEEMLKDVCNSQKDFSAICLRYFNPVGAHESGLIGEDPKDIPNNLMPYIAQVASGKLKKLNIFGDDYPTQDGTCVRDYIHVMDLARGHVSALSYSEDSSGWHAFNLGTGSGVSVLELVKTFEKVNQLTIPYKITPRRSGDIAEFFSNSNKANMLLNWSAEKDIGDMCCDTWKFQMKSKESNL
jgi:UDP-glucose 4-epimerase